MNTHMTHTILTAAFSLVEWFDHGAAEHTNIDTHKDADVFADFLEWSITPSTWEMAAEHTGATVTEQVKECVISMYRGRASAPADPFQGLV